MTSTREEQHYEIAGQEVAEKRLAPAIWSKAFSQSLGNQQAALALYIKFRVEQLERNYQTEESKATQEKQNRKKEKDAEELGKFFCRVMSVVACFFVFLMVRSVIWLESLAETPSVSA